MDFDELDRVVKYWCKENVLPLIKILYVFWFIHCNCVFSFLRTLFDLLQYIPQFYRVSYQQNFSKQITIVFKVIVSLL